MKDNSLKRDGGNIRQGAAEINPADYPLRSPESRAAARALVSQRTALSPADSDAMTLYRAGHWLSTQELRPLEATQTGRHSAVERVDRVLAQPVAGRLDAANDGR